MLEDVKIWSRLQLGYKVKNRYMCVYFTGEQIFSTASCHSFNRVLQPGYKQAFSMLLLGDTCKQLSFCQRPGDHFPTSLLTADTQICLWQRPPKLPKHLLPQHRILQWKIFPRSPLCLMVVSLSRLPLSEAFCPTAPMEALPAPELHLTAQNQPLCTSVGLQDMLAASAFPLLHLEIYSNLSEVVRGT